MQESPPSRPGSGPEVHFVGQERTAVIQADGLLANPRAFVAAAAEARYSADAEYYPGVRAPVPADLHPELFARATEAIGQRYGAGRRASVAQAFFALVSTPASRLSPPQRIPHYDASDDHLLAMVLYLSERDWGGTGFFRHRATGYETITESRQASYFTALRQDIDHVGPPRAAYCTLDNPLYEPVAAIGAAFNRALIYPGKLLHSGLIDNANVPPPTPLRGRLTITCFIRLADDQTASGEALNK